MYILILAAFQLYKFCSLFLNRSDSPPVPAVKNRLQQQRKTPDFPAHDSSNGREIRTDTEKHQSESPPPSAGIERPPSSHFVPYVRTNEVYYLDPDAPMTRPATHDPQHQQLNGTIIKRNAYDQ